MTKRKDKIEAFIRALPTNIFSGLVVSLIALPLGLGLAMASEAPAIAGVIAAIVGGIVVSILGGSHVTIAGPGNGMVGVLLVAITTLGLESTYAAVICSGALVMLLGFLKLGKLSDFFPTSAIQGMLAAIGLIILGKQFHIMLAHKIKRDDTLDYILEIPFTLSHAFEYESRGLLYAAIAGVFSLFVMVIYPKLRNKYLQLIPAPMWIVIIFIALSYYFEVVAGEPNPIAQNYMLSGIPSAQEVITNLPIPDFGKIGDFQFWGSVLGLTLIASIESLLSIKAVDMLDPEKRRSNVNKDLKALGLATIGSGFLGGINVVTVIARSSVNVNTGGSNRSSNFSHAIFLLLFIALFSSQLARIPLTALMAILVFTGYKLASPNVIRHIFSIGKEQLIIFGVTLLVTLKIGLITGIIAGVITTFIIHVIITKNLALFARNILKPNVLMFEEEGAQSNYYVSVKHFCSFLNYYRLKEKLDAIPEDQDVVVDFSLCEFVDHTVMQNLHTYQELFTKRDGHFDIVGLDMHDADSDHPFALRRILPIPKLLNNFTRRQSSLEEFAEHFSLNYVVEKNKETHFLDSFLFFRTKKLHFTNNCISNKTNSIHLFDIEFSEGEFIAKEVIRSTMLYIKLEQSIPKFTLDREGFLEKIYAFAGVKDIPIKGHTDFSKRFYLLGEDHDGILAFFNDDLIAFFESNPYYHVESNGKALLVFEKERLSSIKEIKAIYDFGKRLHNLIASAHHG